MRNRERSTCGGGGVRNSIGQGNKEGATAIEGDSGVAGLSDASHYSESANDGPPHNPADVYGVPPPVVPTTESELSAHAESGSYAFLNSSQVQEAIVKGGTCMHVCLCINVTIDFSPKKGQSFVPVYMYGQHIGKIQSMLRALSPAYPAGKSRQTN